MQIRNFSIIAHIDHGKSTLADRFLEITKTIPKDKLKPQFLDLMDLEREKGITIKMQPVRMMYKGYILNLIDTPGHIDFKYEVSRSLACSEGAILLVDATKGVQAQTIQNLLLALNQNLKIIPVINKIDIKNADISKVKSQIISILGCNKTEILLCSAKTGEGVEEVLKAVIERIPAPKIDLNSPKRALVFDSLYDEYKGVINYIRVFEGKFKKGDRIKFFASKIESEILEVGYFTPFFTKTNELKSGEIGYAITGIKEISNCEVGDTMYGKNDKIIPIKGYKKVKPMIFVSCFPKNKSQFDDFKKALEKLKLQDYALYFKPERIKNLGYGFKLGVLGLLHLEIIKERLKREFKIDIILTIPSVEYKVYLKNGKIEKIYQADDLPEKNKIDKIEEIFVKLNILTPIKYQSKVIELLKRYKVDLKEIKIKDLVEINGNAPLSAIILDLFPKLKAVSSGYASMDYEILGYRQTDVEKLEIYVENEKVQGLSMLVDSNSAYKKAREIVDKLKEILPRQIFEIKIQAKFKGKIIASSKIPPYKKDVIAKLYGGDVTRKLKLLKKQKHRKKIKREYAKIKIPSDVYIKLFKI